MVRGGRDVRVNGARVDPRSFEKRRVEPQAPKADKKPKPDRTSHDPINTTQQSVVRQGPAFEDAR